MSSTNPASVLLLDNTLPKAPAVLIERSNNGLDFWEAQQTLKATISPTGTGDVLEISSVKFNGVNVDYNADQKFFTFDVPDSLAVRLMISQQILQIAAETRKYMQPVLT